MHKGPRAKHIRMILLTMSLMSVRIDASLDTSKDDHEFSCSKFHFDEKVLEKLVRLEHSNSIIMDEFNEVKEKVKADLDKTMKETEEMKTTMRKELESLKEWKKWNNS